MITLAVCLFMASIVFFQWRAHEFEKWVRIHEWVCEKTKIDIAKSHGSAEMVALRLELEEYKKRVDTLTLKAGFKL